MPDKHRTGPNERTGIYLTFKQKSAPHAKKTLHARQTAPRTVRLNSRLSTNARPPTACLHCQTIDIHDKHQMILILRLIFNLIIELISVQLNTQNEKTYFRSFSTTFPEQTTIPRTAPAPFHHCPRRHPLSETTRPIPIHRPGPRRHFDKTSFAGYPAGLKYTGTPQARHCLRFRKKP